MANPTFKMGLKPVRFVDGRSFDGNVVRMYIPASYATDVFIGDPVVKTGTSNTAAVATCSSKYKIGSLAEVNRAAFGTGNIIDGVVVGFDPTPASVLATTIAGKQIYGKASTERVALVVLGPDVLFHVRDDGGAVLAATTVGLNAVLIDGSGDTVTGVSGVKLDAGTTTAPATTAAFQLKILGVADIPNNDTGAVACVWEVSINQNRQANIVAGV